MFDFRLIFMHIDDGVNNRHNIKKPTPKGVNNNMKLIILFGAGAVGKMTVGQALSKITD